MKKNERKPSFFKRLLFTLYRRCPYCGETVTEEWYSTLDFGYRSRCGNCKTEFVCKNSYYDR